jgi:hypothetical protein
MELLMDILDNYIIILAKCYKEASVYAKMS